jgi:hypothetical protein
MINNCPYCGSLNLSEGSTVEGWQCFSCDQEFGIAEWPYEEEDEECMICNGVGLAPSIFIKDCNVCLGTGMSLRWKIQATQH